MEPGELVYVVELNGDGYEWNNYGTFRTFAEAFARFMEVARIEHRPATEEDVSNFEG